jgi:hypothetical protein
LSRDIAALLPVYIIKAAGADGNKSARYLHKKHACIAQRDLQRVSIPMQDAYHLENVLQV